MEQTITSNESVEIKRALISVSNKSGLIPFAKHLEILGVEILSTGGTAQILKDEGIKVKDVSEHTGFPEIMNGRVKTLHPKIHGGILSIRDNDQHRQEQQENNIEDIDLVVINLYPFIETVKSGADFNKCIENIDIGGPAMIRASAKNHKYITIVTDPNDYDMVISEINAHKGKTNYKLRKHLAAKAYSLTATYDSNIAGWFSSQAGECYPDRISFSGDLKQKLRYGENPHQNASLYLDGTNRPGIATATQIQGKELSYNNLNDTDAAFELVSEFDEPAVAIIKHANPCGVSLGENTLDAYLNALKCDSVSSFGGIIALNRPLNAETAEKITEIFSEVIIAPSIEPEAMNIVAKKKNLRVITTGAMPSPMDKRLSVKTISGGLLVQDYDTGNLTIDDIKIVTDREPTEKELNDLFFAFKVAKHVKSNAIVYAKDQSTVGIGAGQMSRIDSCKIAVQKSIDAAKHANETEPLTKGSVVASDAFFPFADGLIEAAQAGVTAIIQPGGSIRDEEVIKAANERGLAMVFTGIRHFKH